MRRPRPAPMHGGAVVPHHHVAAAPYVYSGCRARWLAAVSSSISFSPALDPCLQPHKHVMRDKARLQPLTGLVHTMRQHCGGSAASSSRVARPGAILRRECAVMMPSEGIFQFALQRRIEPLESKPGRDEFGLAAARRNDARRQHRGQRRRRLERTSRCARADWPCCASHSGDLAARLCRPCRWW